MSGTPVSVHFRWFERCFGLRNSPGPLESSMQVLVALHRGSCVTRLCWPLAASSCVLTRGAGTGLGSREETGGADLSSIVYFSKWPLSDAAVWWHSFSPDKALWQRSLHVQGTRWDRAWPTKSSLGEDNNCVEIMPCLWRNPPAVGMHYVKCCKLLIEQWNWLRYAMLLLL